MADPQTSLVPASQTSHLPARVQGPVSPEACHRSPTLMAGAAPGDGGGVRVWSPSRRRLWIGTVTSGLLLIAMVAATFLWIHGPGLIYSGVLAFCTTLYGIRALLRPCYITTDEFGIAITTPRGSRSFRWTDIKRCDIRIANSHRPAGMIFFVPDEAEAALTGYSARDIKEITSLVKQRADLVLHPQFKHRYVQSGSFPVLLNPVNVGIGITFERNSDDQLIASAIEDHSPAVDAGLMQGDHILSINRLDTDDMDEASAASECRGPEGAPISLKVERELWHKPLELMVRTRSGFD